MRERRYVHAFIGGALVVAAMVLVTAAPARAQASGAAPAQGPSLYKRLGGYDAIAAVTDDFIGRLATDPSFARFFAGFSEDSKGRIRQLIVDQICSVTGGPCIYLGRDMKTAHKGLGISGKDWDASVVLLTQSLDKFKVGPQEKADFLALVSTLKKDIVEKP